MSEQQTAADPGRGPRQLVLCLDGTNNNITGGRSDTNVTKLCQVLAPDGQGQLLYYDPGVGNPGSIPGVTWQDMIRGKAERLWGLAFGKGIYENIAEAYLFLMRNFRPEDQIFVYGFSRGAFTARSVAGMVARFGIMRASMEGMVPTLLHLYFADASKDPENYTAILKQIAECFCDPAGAQAEVWFVGVWDTVHSVGSPLSRPKIKAAPTIVGKRFRHVRQALALDEYRRSFTPRPYYLHPTHNYAADGQSIEQLWWRGAHCDVGGGYEEDEAALSDECLLWMLQESVTQGLVLKAGLVDGQRNLDQAATSAAVRAPAQEVRPARKPLAHSETFYEAYWALTGLNIRRFGDVKGLPADPPAAPPLEHPSVAQTALQFPQDTCWSRPRKRKAQLASALMAAVAFWLLHGMALSGTSGLELMSGWTDFLGLWDGLEQLVQANVDLIRWQVGWWRGGPDAVAAMPTVAHPSWMVLADVGFILSYGYVLARALAWGFAGAARLRRLSQKHPALLNALGMSGALIVGADLAEDSLMLLAMGLGWLDWTLPQDGAALAMSAASAFKWLGFVPAAVLVAWGSLRQWRIGRKRQAATAISLSS